MGKDGLVIPLSADRIIQFDFPGRIPSKKNSKQIRKNRKTGKFFLSSSDNHEVWHKTHILKLKNVPQRPFSEEEVQCVVFVYFSPDKRKYDLSNKWETVGDLLVDRKVIVDDNYKIINKAIMLHGGVDKEKPRGEVFLFLKKML